MNPKIREHKKRNNEQLAAKNIQNHSDKKNLLSQSFARRTFTVRAKFWQTARRNYLAHAKLFCGPREETGSKCRFAHSDSVSCDTQRTFVQRFYDLVQKLTVSREDSWICTESYAQQTKKMKNSTARGQKNWFFWPHGGRQKCVCVMWASYFTHTSARSLFEGSSQYEHCIVHPKICLQDDLLPSI